MFKWMLCTKGTIWWRIKRVCSYFFLFVFICGKYPTTPGITPSGKYIASVCKYRRRIILVILLRSNVRFER